MRGRPEADWQQRVDSDDPTAQLPALLGLGFDGIVVDTAGYADGGAALTDRLTETVGPPDVVSSSGRWRFWDLRGYASKRKLSAQQLHQAARGLVGARLVAEAAKG
jgi:hypothetical protein